MEEAISKDNERVLGKDAQRTNILAARVISETVTLSYTITASS